MQCAPGDTAVTKLRLATDRRRQNGETEADWRNIVVWGKTAKAVNQNVGKGQRVYVAGRLVQNSWETEDGQHRHRTEVVFLDNRNGNGGLEGGGRLPLLARRSTTEHRRPHQPSARTTAPLPTTGADPLLVLTDR